MLLFLVFSRRNFSKATLAQKINNWLRSCPETKRRNHLASYWWITFQSKKFAIILMYFSWENVTKKFHDSKIWKWSFQPENKLLLSYPCRKHANEILRSLTATRLKVKNLYTCTMEKSIFAHFECPFFILVHDTVILCSFHDVKWPALQLFGRREHLVTIFNFSCLTP